MPTSIDVGFENIVPLADLGRCVGQPMSYRRVWRYTKVGSLNRNTGVRVKLETINTPAGLATSVEAYKRFIEALNE